MNSTTTPTTIESTNETSSTSSSFIETKILPNLTLIIILMAIAITIFSIIFLLKIFNRRRFKWKTNNGQYWAVITGPTDGIGYEFAKQLAHKGYNLMLLSRNQDKLEKTKLRILDSLHQSGKFDLEKNIKFRSLMVDFNDSSEQNYNRIKEFLLVNEFDIFILINNVGIAPDNLLPFDQEDPELHMQMININIIAMTKMIEMILPSMILKRRGLILNMASIAVKYPMPTFAQQSATKAYILQLSESIQEECRWANILIQTLIPGLISTNMTYNVRSSIWIPTPETYVRSALKSIRWGKTKTFGYWPHKFLDILWQNFVRITSRQWSARFIHTISQVMMEEKLRLNLKRSNDSTTISAQPQFQIRNEVLLQVFWAWILTWFGKRPKSYDNKSS